jgi:hypothetical protein
MKKLLHPSVLLSQYYPQSTMAPTTRSRANWAAPLVAALPEMWALFAEHGVDFVDAFRLMSVCRASRVGVKGWLRTLPGLVVCGVRATGGVGEGTTSEVWRLDLGELRWERMPSLTRKRYNHACCAVRGGVVVLGGYGEGQYGSYEDTASVEILGCDPVAEEDSFFFFRRCRAAASPAPLQWRSMRARATRGKCSFMEVVSRMEAYHRRCKRLTWRLGCALRNLLSFPNMGLFWVIRLRAWQTGASCTWPRTTIIRCKERHKCWSRRRRQNTGR